MSRDDEVTPPMTMGQRLRLEWKRIDTRLEALEGILKGVRVEWQEVLAEVRREAQAFVDERWREHVEKLNDEFRKGIAELELRLEAKVARDVADASERVRGRR